MFIYLDESGDLGFDFSKRGTSQYLTITILICNSNLARKDIRKAVKRTLKKLNHKGNKSRPVYELKGTGTTFEIKQYFYRHIHRDDWNIYSLILNKYRVEQHLRTKTGRKKLYNFLSRLLIEQIDLSVVKQSVSLIVDKCKNKKEIRDFNNYLVSQLEAKLPLNTPLHISHLTSNESPELQATDLFCWGIARKYRMDDLEWYNIFKRKIYYETIYLP